MIKEAFSCPNADVHFLVGGTQTNLTVICAALRPHQAVYGAVPSHINTHEAGAIEHVGHRVLPLPSDDGKLTAEQIRHEWKMYDTDPSREHWAQPKMVYISQPTEIGSMYSKKELQDLYQACKDCGLYLFVDGARLGYVLGAPDNDMTAADLAVDAAKIGEAGSLTKVLKLYEPPKKQAGVKIQEETVADSTMRALAMIAEAKVL